MQFNEGDSSELSNSFKFSKKNFYRTARTKISEEEINLLKNSTEENNDLSSSLTKKSMAQDCMDLRNLVKSSVENVTDLINNKMNTRKIERFEIIEERDEENNKIIENRKKIFNSSFIENPNNLSSSMTKRTTKTRNYSCNRKLDTLISNAKNKYQQVNPELGNNKNSYVLSGHHQSNKTLDMGKIKKVSSPIITNGLYKPAVSKPGKYINQPGGSNKRDTDKNFNKAKLPTTTQSTPHNNSKRETTFKKQIVPSKLYNKLDTSLNLSINCPLKQKQHKKSSLTSRSSKDKIVMNNNDSKILNDTILYENENLFKGFLTMISIFTQYYVEGKSGASANERAIMNLIKSLEDQSSNFVVGSSANSVLSKVNANKHEKAERKESLINKTERLVKTIQRNWRKFKLRKLLSIEKGCTSFSEFYIDQSLQSVLFKRLNSDENFSNFITMLNYSQKLFMELLENNGIIRF